MYLFFCFLKKILVMHVFCKIKNGSKYALNEKLFEQNHEDDNVCFPSLLAANVRSYIFLPVAW